MSAIKAPARFKVGDTYQHPDPDEPRVIVIRLRGGAWRRVSRKTGEEQPVWPNNYMGYAKADDWVRYLIERCNYVKVEG